MLRVRTVVLSVVFAFICGSSLAVAQNRQESSDDLCIPLGVISLKPPQSVKQDKSPVDFPHSRHFLFNCRQCHHTWDLNTPISDCMASGCHDLTKAPARSEGVNEVSYYKKAFHDKCIGCHKEIRRQNLALEKKASIDAENIKIQRVGPTGCIDCHAKE